MSGLTKKELDEIKARANKVLDNSSNYDEVTLQLATCIRMLLLDKKIKGK